MRSKRALPDFLVGLIAVVCVAHGNAGLFAQNRFATSDNMSGYVHWIHLYDANNSRIEPGRENLKPYSPEKTCGRCHEFDTISHGWHFNKTTGEFNIDWIPESEKNHFDCYR